MEIQKTPAAKKLPSWLRSFRTSKNVAPTNDENASKTAAAQPKGFLRSYRRSLGFKKNAGAGEVQAGSLDGDNFARGSLMSIRKLWAAEATGKTLNTGANTECVSKKPCAKPHISGSPSKIPISAQMQVQHKTHRHSFHQSWCPSNNKENCVPSSTVPRQTSDGQNYSSAGSSDGNLASEIVLSAARHAKNRRSSCNFKEQEVWKAAVNNVGLPRTSTETGQLQKLVDDRVRNQPLSLVKDSVNTADRATQYDIVQSWVLHHDNPISTTAELQTAGRFASQSLQDCTTIPKSLYFAPVIPPRTYLAKLAHAKAHLARTGTLDPHIKGGPQKAFPAGVRPVPCKQRHVTIAGTFLPPSLPKKENCASGGHLPNCSRATAARCMKKVPSNPQATKRLVPARGQHNPTYGVASPNRTSRNWKSGCGVESDVMADDEISVLNCSCQRCLQKFSNVRWQPEARKGNPGRNVQVASKATCTLPGDSKHSGNAGNHCQCCHCKNLAGISKMANTETLKTKECAAPLAHKQPIAKKQAAAKSILNRKDEISRVVEEAVKASIEKLLSMHSVSPLSRSRSVESLQEPTPTKSKPVTSPLKYILLSSCRTGVVDSLADFITDTKTESGIVMSQPSSSTEEASAERISFQDVPLRLDSDSITRQPRSELERTTSLPSLVESCSPSKTRVSTAFIKLVKRVKTTGDQEETGSQNVQTKEDQDERHISTTDAHSTCSSSATGECWHTAESLTAEDSCSQTEGMTCNLDDGGPSPGALEEQSQHSAGCPEEGLEKADEASQNGTSICLPKAKPEISGSCASVGTLFSRHSPDGWERTPPTDRSAEMEADEDEPSELNPEGAENCDDLCFSDDTGTSDEEDDQRILEEVIRKGMGMTPPIRLPVKLPRPVKMPRKFKPAEFFGGKAKLKLAAYTNSGHVTIHIIRALKLMTSRGAPANAYVKVALQPDFARRAHWRTAVVKSCRNPEFDHKFSFELMEEDADKRLFITVWHRDTDNKRSELLGSMSFAMNKILDSPQYARGWYRLLRQDLGMRKHFAARCKKRRDGEQATSA
ncbi:unnamed protein product [Ixodes hexagonus]